ncbi:unnamed protein product, partial [marine sediment metagenome]
SAYHLANIPDFRRDTYFQPPETPKLSAFS